MLGKLSDPGGNLLHSRKYLVMWEDSEVPGIGGLVENQWGNRKSVNEMDVDQRGLALSDEEHQERQGKELYFQHGNMKRKR